MHKSPYPQIWIFFLEFLSTKETEVIGKGKKEISSLFFFLRCCIQKHGPPTGVAAIPAELYHVYWKNVYITRAVLPRFFLYPLGPS